MSDATAFGFGKFIPGFDFLQQLAAHQSGAASPAPGLAGWIAPTVSVEELDRRITELKTVQFWLDQNATAIKATIQALEVQKMTLVTLQGMNLSMAEVVKTLTLPTETAVAPAEPPASAQRAAHAPPADQPAPQPAPAASPADPVQWWGALTQQFQHIAANALRESTSATAAPTAANAPKAKAPRPPATDKKPVGKRAPRKKAP